MLRVLPWCKCLNLKWMPPPAGSAWNRAGTRPASMASDARKGEAPAWVVVFGLDLQAIIGDGVEGAGGRRGERSKLRIMTKAE